MTEYQIAEEIRKATKERKQGNKESLNEFKMRLVYASDALEDEIYDGLCTPSRDWLNSCIRAIKEAKDLNKGIEPKPDNINLPLFLEESQKERDNDQNSVDSENGVRIRQRHKPAMGRKPKEGAQWYMKLLIAKNPNISYVALQNTLEKDHGYTVSKSTCYGVLANFRQSMKALQSLGMLITWESKYPDGES